MQRDDHFGTYAALWPENLDGCADAVEMLRSACWRTDVKEIIPYLYYFIPETGKRIFQTV